MESNTKTVAKRARVGPRTQVHATMKKLFLMKILWTSCLGSPIIVVDMILLITLRNDNVMEKFYCLKVY